ncbi:hypothetical protein BAE44_0018852 [Dichanthelium oligosanthes]|uniref:Uncharacterized protein n=1 Tax=Dichanthelium oligosanthes TaxID=888268 RepID=A0A1E5V4P1_9POAL|nr:hypothetical protein BAE44_0018852 [Dichanthelium oligosanthes]
MDSTRKAAEYAVAPGGEAVAEAMRRQAASAAALGKLAEEYAAFMRRVGALPASDSDSDSSAAAARPARCRRRNARFFGPEWSN